MGSLAPQNFKDNVVVEPALEPPQPDSVSRVVIAINARTTAFRQTLDSVITFSSPPQIELARSHIRTPREPPVRWFPA